MTELLEVTFVVTTALEKCRVRYTVGGSLASSYSGEPRASIDADILVEMTPPQIEAFLQALGTDFYADADALHRAIATRTTTNLIHRPTGVKIDLFVASSHLDRCQLERRRHVQIGTKPDRFLYVHSPEDILLQKLVWYRQGGQVSDRQWRDAISIILVQGNRLDREYLTTTAAMAGVADLLERAYQSAGRT